MKQLWILLCLLPVAAFSQPFEFTKSIDDVPSSPNALLQDVAWIAGHWRGEAMGAFTEEIWAPPLGGSMMGSFKLAGPDSVQFYELMHIQQQGLKLMLEIRHFHGNLFAWEEKEETEEFPLVEITTDAVYFDGLTFVRTGEDELTIYVRIGSGDKVREVAFRYDRFVE